ncbi:methyl-accepting chemotaxis sensory transducer [Desulfovibrio sp. X2]|uniref:methyl-accepting chemotaxis protein n=1 Tax=Desulfovibrio sp. X2 TaxID=941449 RepID=UPI000358ACF3|nr:methyl-accepting chemotaxis protein [Desulfovibrio sp. X2]EPR41949.1 methyl-accepting chemotaxis sensory transducer [Desulfovibrio sp. X2]
MNPAVVAAAVAVLFTLLAGLAAWFLPAGLSAPAVAGLVVLLAVAAGLLARLFVARALAATLAPLAAAARGEADTAALPATGPLAPVCAAVASLAAAAKASDERLAEAQRCQADWQAADKAAEAKADRAARRQQVVGKSMSEAAATLKSVSANITEFAASLARETEKVSSGAETQRGRVESAAAAVEEMNATNAEMAKNAKAASDSAESTRTMAQQGAEVVTESVSAIRTLAGVMDGLRSDMEQLGTKAESIGKVMTVISDIADQTNLLALNAAIEAARAGDAGRGFAVVADEVRKLAEKTMSATKEVDDVIRGIQNGTSKSLESMGQASSAVKRAEDLSGRSGDMLSGILDLANGTSDQMRAIAAASTQQSVASDEVAHSMETLAGFSGETAREMTSALDSIHKLDGQIQELVKLGGVFRIISEGTVLAEVERMIHNPDIAAMDPGRAEQAMRRYVDQLPFLELLYLTDASGRQITANIPARDVHLKDAASARGKNWSSRPWFTGAIENQDAYLSSIYVSDASGDYCLTVSAPVMRGETIVGVLGADIKLFG